MCRLAIRLATVLIVVFVGHDIAEASKEPASVPTLIGQTKATVTFAPDSITLTFGPFSLSDHPHALMPKYVFEAPKDMFLTSYTAKFSTSRGKDIPRRYIHHILLSKLAEVNSACPGTLNFFAGMGFELTEAVLPTGYGVKLTKGEKIMALVALHEHLPPVDDAVVTLFLHLAPDGSELQPLQTYHIGVNIGCRIDDMAQDETEHGIKLPQGVLVRAVPVKFSIEGCVKYAYPHGHDQLVLMALENKTKRRTLLRTVPNVSSDGALQFFSADQVYSSNIGFPVNTTDTYEVTMIYHLALEDASELYGMANYNLYLTPGQCAQLSSHNSGAKK